MSSNGEVYGSQLSMNLLYGTILAVKIWKISGKFVDPSHTIRQTLLL